jgi:hypothetical protein
MFYLTFADMERPASAVCERYLHPSDLNKAKFHLQSQYIFLAS